MPDCENWIQLREASQAAGREMGQRSGGKLSSDCGVRCNGRTADVDEQAEFMSASSLTPKACLQLRPVNVPIPGHWAGVMSLSE